MTRGTAHGKVILFGEHAVVYGVPALAVGIDRGAWAEARHEISASGESTMRVAAWNVTVGESRRGEQSSPLAGALREVLRATREAQAAAGEPVLGAVSIEAHADLPPGGGLGCSAALGVAVTRALDPSASADAVSARADAWERVFHGNPSGVDAAVAARGGCVQYTRSEAGAPAIERIRVPGALHLCIGQSGIASSTKAMVESVARMRERRPEVTDRAFDAIHTLVKNARLALADGDLRAVGQLLDLNQMLLSGLFVSSPEIEHMCGAARAAGALGAKLTGAGGGGCVIALVENAARGADVLSAWKKDGYDGFAAVVKPDVQDVLEILANRSRGVVAAGS